jgi:hypothetical protein
MSGPGAALEAAIRLALGADPDTRIFRNNVGKGWQGRLERRTPFSVTLSSPRLIGFGLAEGSGDFIAVRRVVVTPEMVGQTIGVFGSIEVKSGSGRTDPAQRAWLRTMRAFGARAGVARSVDDARAILDGELVG